ncbi:MAG: hypothetical protein Roseis2KO_17090 [Roseivirga sp.]
MTAAEALHKAISEQYGPYHEATATTAYNLAVIYTQAGAVAKAEEALEQAINCFKKGDDDMISGMAYGLRAIMLTGPTKVSSLESERAFRQAEYSLSKAPEENLNLIMAGLYYQWGFSQMNAGEASKSERTLDQTLEILKRLPDTHREYATTLETKAILYTMHFNNASQGQSAFKASFDLREQHKEDWLEYQHGLYMMDEFIPERFKQLEAELDEERLDDSRSLHFMPSQHIPYMLRPDFPPFYMAYPEIMNDRIDDETAKRIMEVQYDPRAGERAAMEFEKLASNTDLNSEEYTQQILDAFSDTSSVIGKHFQKEVVKSMTSIFGAEKGSQFGDINVFTDPLRAQKAMWGENSYFYLMNMRNVAKNAKATKDFKLALTLYEDLAAIYLDRFRKFTYTSEIEKKTMWDQSRQDLNDYYDLIYQLDDQPEAIRKAADFRLQTKGQILNSSAKIRQLAQKHKSDEVRSVYRQWIEARENLATAAQVNDPQLIEKTASVNRLEKQLADRLPYLAAENEQQTLTSLSVQQAVPANAVAVEILRVASVKLEPDGYGMFNTLDSAMVYRAFVMGPGQGNVNVIELGAAGPLEREFYQLYKEYTSASRYERDNTAKYQALTQAYWQPLVSQLPPATNRVFISTDGVFNLINIGVLPEREGPVLASTDIHYLSNLKELVSREPSEGPQQITLFGNPSYEMTTERFAELATAAIPERNLAQGTKNHIAYWIKRARIAQLPGTEEETNEIASLFNELHWEVQHHLGDMATEQRVKSVADTKVLHIATHGYFDRTNSGLRAKEATVDDNMDQRLSYERAPADAMLYSGLLFAGVKNYFSETDKTADLTEDGILTAYEVSTMALDQTELVVLSACNSGRGLVDASEGVYGMQRAFKLAGAQSVLMSMWQVNDRVTTQLITSFYRNWQGGMSRMQALKQAQLSLMQQHPEPYYWAGFILLD